MQCKQYLNRNPIHPSSDIAVSEKGKKEPYSLWCFLFHSACRQKIFQVMLLLVSIICVDNKASASLVINGGNSGWIQVPILRPPSTAGVTNFPLEERQVWLFQHSVLVSVQTIQNIRMLYRLVQRYRGNYTSLLEEALLLFLLLFLTLFFRFFPGCCCLDSGFSSPVSACWWWK